MKPLNVMILHAPTGIAGAEGVILNINRFMDPERIRLFNCPFINFSRGESAYLKELEKRGIPYDATPLVKRFEYRYVRATRDLIRKHGIDLIHSHGYRSDITALLASGGRTPVVAMMHGFTASSFKVKIYETLERIILKRVAMIIPVSAQMKKLALGMGIPDEKVRLLPNVVDNITLDKIKPSAVFDEMALSPDVFKMAFVGRISPEKGLDLLLDACSALKKEGVNFFLMIAGDGPLKSDMEERTRDLGLADNVRFLGFRSDAPAITSAADVFLLPSLTEGIPLVVLESMAVGTPVIASMVGGVPDLIKNRETGYLFSPGNIEELAECIRNVYKNRSQARQMSERAKAFVNSSYSPLNWAEELTSIYLKASNRI